MESRRRAELLATLSPEGRATYEVLRVQLARDLDRCFAESKARLEKGVEAAFGDLRRKCSPVPGRDNAERAKEIVAATATSTPATSHALSNPRARAASATAPSSSTTSASTRSTTSTSVLAAKATDISTPTMISIPPASGDIDLVLAPNAATPLVREDLLQLVPPTGVLGVIPSKLTSSTVPPSSSPMGYVVPASAATSNSSSSGDTDIVVALPVTCSSICLRGDSAAGTTTSTPTEVLVLPTSLISLREDSPTLLCEPLAFFEQDMVLATTCSTECSGSNLDVPSPAFSTTHATASRLLPAAAAALDLELRVRVRMSPTTCSCVSVREDGIDSADTYTMEVSMTMEDKFLTTPAPSEVWIFKSLRLIVDHGLCTSAVITSIKEQGQEIRPAPWPTFISNTHTVHHHHQVMYWAHLRRARPWTLSTPWPTIVCGIESMLPDAQIIPPSESLISQSLQFFIDRKLHTWMPTKCLKMSHNLNTPSLMMTLTPELDIIDIVVAEQQDSNVENGNYVQKVDIYLVQPVIAISFSPTEPRKSTWREVLSQYSAPKILELPQAHNTDFLVNELELFLASTQLSLDSAIVLPRGQDCVVLLVELDHWPTWKLLGWFCTVIRCPQYLSVIPVPDTDGDKFRPQLHQASREGLYNLLTESACSLLGIPIAVPFVICSREAMAKHHITCSHVGVLWRYLSCELQSKENLVERAYWRLIAEVCLKELKRPWPPPKALLIQAPKFGHSKVIKLKIAWLLVVSLSDIGERILQASSIDICYCGVGVGVAACCKLGIKFRSADAYLSALHKLQFTDACFSPGVAIPILLFERVNWEELRPPTDTTEKGLSGAFPLPVQTYGFGMSSARGRAEIHGERIVSGQVHYSYERSVPDNSYLKILVDCPALKLVSCKFPQELLLTWDPGESLYFPAAYVVDAEDVKLRSSVPWDPGGSILIRLEGKPNFMGGGLSATFPTLLPGLDSGLLLGLGPVQKQWQAATTITGGDGNKRLCLERTGGFGRGSLARIAPVHHLLPLIPFLLRFLYNSKL